MGKDRNWSGILTAGIVLGLFGMALHSSNKANQETEERKSHTVHFNGIISKDRFDRIVYSCGSRYRRINILEIDGPYVKGRVLSQSGLSTWDFEIDYNDYGKLTGKYWLYQENDDASIPGHLADDIAGFIQYFQKNGYSDSYFWRNSNQYNNVQYENPSNEPGYTPKKKFSWKAAGIIAIVILVLYACNIIVGLIVSAYVEWEHRNYVEIGFTAESCLNRNYEEVAEDFEDLGFTDISIVELKDLDADQLELEGMVCSVSIDDNNDFLIDDEYDYHEDVVIEYHSAKLINAPISSEDGKGENYKDVAIVFEKAGFTNITYDIKYDLITDWLIKDGEVKSISINGRKNYSIHTDFRVDSEVVITYHTYLKNEEN